MSKVKWQKLSSKTFKVRDSFGNRELNYRVVITEYSFGKNQFIIKLPCGDERFVTGRLGDSIKVTNFLFDIISTLVSDEVEQDKIFNKILNYVSLYI